LSRWLLLVDPFHPTGSWAKVVQKLRCMEKIVRSINKAKIAEKLRGARSQFSGGGTTCWSCVRNGIVWFVEVATVTL